MVRRLGRPADRATYYDSKALRVLEWDFSNLNEATEALSLMSPYPGMVYTVGDAELVEPAAAPAPALAPVVPFDLAAVGGALPPLRWE